MSLKNIIKHEITKQWTTEINPKIVNLYGAISHRDNAMVLVYQIQTMHRQVLCHDSWCRRGPVWFICNPGTGKKVKIETTDRGSKTS